MTTAVATKQAVATSEPALPADLPLALRVEGDGSDLDPSARAAIVEKIVAGFCDAWRNSLPQYARAGLRLAWEGRNDPALVIDFKMIELTGSLISAIAWASGVGDPITFRARECAQMPHEVIATIFCHELAHCYVFHFRNCCPGELGSVLVPGNLDEHIAERIQSVWGMPHEVFYRWWQARYEARRKAQPAAEPEVPQVVDEVMVEARKILAQGVKDGDPLASFLWLQMGKAKC